MNNDLFKFQIHPLPQNESRQRLSNEALHFTFGDQSPPQQTQEEYVRPPQYTQHSNSLDQQHPKEERLSDSGFPSFVFQPNPTFYGLKKEISLENNQESDSESSLMFLNESPPQQTQEEYVQPPQYTQHSNSLDQQHPKEERFSDSGLSGFVFQPNPTFHGLKKEISLENNQESDSESSFMFLNESPPQQIQPANTVPKIPRRFQQIIASLSEKHSPDVPEATNAWSKLCPDPQIAKAVMLMIGTKKQFTTFINSPDSTKILESLNTAKNRGALHSISSMQNKRGMPTAEKITDFVNYFENNYGAQVKRGLREKISSMQATQGIPTTQKITEFLKHFTNEEGKVNMKLLGAIARDYRAKGIPTSQETMDSINDLKK